MPDFYLNIVLLLLIMNKLTVIIPFLNEGEELENTLRSIREHADGEVDILVINDASTDGWDYGSVARKFRAEYVVNERRMGVAASRDLGVERCRTPYFLLLDAHMRFYDRDWVGTIVSELEGEERSLLCCQTKVLTKENGCVAECDSGRTFGAFLDFSEGGAMQLHWKGNERCVGECIEDIPCVLGAGYACAVWYWKYLKGLRGLRFYGCDEAYISLKVWLEGGRCRLLKKVVVGHIYRSRFPYQVSNADIFYNQMLIAETLLPDDMRDAVFNRLRKESGALFGEAEKMFMANRELIEGLKCDYRRIITRDFSEILKINGESGGRRVDLFACLHPVLNRLVLGCGAVDDAGLYYGKMGLVLLLYYYERCSGRSVYGEFADELLDEVYRGCRNLPVDFAHGVCGIGWAVSCLVRHGFVGGNVNEVLAEVDKKVMERNPLRMTDWSFKTGLSGLLCYVLTRLDDAKRWQAVCPFDEGYLRDLRKAVLRMLGDVQCREDNRMALAYVGCAGNPESGVCSFEIFDFIDFKGMGKPGTGNVLFDLEKGMTGFVFKELFEKNGGKFNAE